MSPLLSWLLVGALWLWTWRWTKRCVAGWREKLDGAERLASLDHDDDPSEWCDAAPGCNCTPCLNTDLSNAERDSDDDPHLDPNRHRQETGCEDCTDLIGRIRGKLLIATAAQARAREDARECERIAALGVYQDKP